MAEYRGRSTWSLGPEVKRSSKWMTVAAFALAVVGIVTVGLNPLRRSDDRVHDWLLRQVPVGSDLATLKAASSLHGWRVNGIWPGHTDHSDWGGIDGATVAWIYIGGYRTLFQTDIDSFWAFDENGKLENVKLRRMTDAL